MLEILIMTACIKGTAIACENASVAYYKQSGTEAAITKKADRLSKDNSELAAAVAITAMAVHGEYLVNLGEGKFLTAEPSKNMIGWKASF